MKSLYIEKVDSTNKWVKVHIKELHDKTLVYTFNQTAGRGRLNRTWCNIGADNIYATFVLKPSEKMAARYSSLTQYFCDLKAIGKYIRPTIPPNNTPHSTAKPAPKSVQK
jgi:biotin-(acetyl-CoA carboxylase) ligase